MESSIKKTDVTFLSKHFDFESFLSSNYDVIFNCEWNNLEILCLNFKEITSEEGEMLSELLKSDRNCFISYFPIKEKLPKYHIVMLEDILNLINKEVFNWFEPLIIFSSNFILINEPDIDKCFISTNLNS